MSKMLIILLICFVNSIVSADESSDETKYIDLLPKKEKDDFLERIARRIFDKVQTKDDRDRDSGEVSEAQLDEHDEFVKKILEEESMNLRKSDNVNSDNENDNNDTKNYIKEADDKSLEKKDDHDAVDDVDQIDLTLRDGKRNKRNSIKRANENSKIIRVTGSEGTNVQNNGNKHQKSQSMQATDGSDVEDIQIKYLNKNVAEHKNEMEVTTQITSDIHRTQIINFDASSVKDHSEETVAPPKDDVDEPSKNAHKSQENLGNIDYNNDDDNAYNNFGSTQKTYELLEKNDTEKDSSEKHKLTEDILSITATEPSSLNFKPQGITTEQLSNLNDTTTEEQQNLNANARFLRSNTVGLTLNNNKKLDTVTVTVDDSKNTDIKKSKSIFVDAAEKLDSEPKTSSGNNSEDAIDNLNDLIIDNHNLSTTNKTTSGNTNEEQSTKIVIDVESITLKMEALTQTPLKTEVETIADQDNVNFKDLIESNVNRLEADTKQENNITKELNLKTKNITPQSAKKLKKNVATDKSSLNLANDMIKILRTEINPEPDLNERNFNGLRDLYENVKPREYNVYEVPPGKQPFIEKTYPEVADKENVHYVPIYNYSPENAYYNPHNRLGPNADDDSENIIMINETVEDEKNKINNHNLDKFGRDDYENDRHDANLELDANYADITVSNELMRDKKNKVVTAKLKSIFRVINKNEDQRKFRFGNTKPKRSKNLGYKLNLPVVVSYPKFTDIYLNPNDYLDMDYYYGRTQDVKPRTNVRNRCVSDDENKKKDEGSVFPDSTEKDHPRNNMHEESLKNHMRAVRLLLYQQKNFSFSKPVNSKESIVQSVSCENDDCKGEEPPKTQLRTSFKNKIPSKHNNIAMDYFFGRMNEDTDTITKEIIYFNSPKETQINFSYEEENRDRRLKNKKRKLKHLNDIVFNGKNYLNNYITPATPAYKDEPIQYYSEPKVLRKKEKKKENSTDFQTIKQILSIANENDLLTTLDKLLKMNLTTRTRDNVDLEPYVIVLKDMVKNGGSGLKQYDWLGTAVDIQSALMKLLDMTDAFQNDAAISQPDLQLLKYTVYLHKSLNVQEKDLRMTILPRNRRKKKGLLKESGLYTRNWLIRKLKNGVFAFDSITKDDLNDFKGFIIDLQYYLDDLHTAIKQIANITEFKNQRWFENLKELYLDTNRKNILEVLLHITTARLLDLVENSAKNGLEDDFLTYVMKNEKDVERTKEEYWFALKIIEELKFRT